MIKIMAALILSVLAVVLPLGPAFAQMSAIEVLRITREGTVLIWYLSPSARFIRSEMLGTIDRTGIDLPPTKFIVSGEVVSIARELFDLSLKGECDNGNKNNCPLIEMLHRNLAEEINKNKHLIHDINEIHFGDEEMPPFDWFPQEQKWPQTT